MSKRTNDMAQKIIEDPTLISGNQSKRVSESVDTMNHFEIDLNEYDKQTQIVHNYAIQSFKVRNKRTDELFVARVFLLDEYQIKSIKLFSNIDIYSKIYHPSLTKFIGFSRVDFSSEPYPIVLTKYYQNQSLDDILFKKSRQNKLVPDWNDTKKLINLYGIAAGMAYLHSQCILAKNLSPSNVLLDDQFYPQITDFLWARTTELQFVGSFECKFYSGPFYSDPKLFDEDDIEYIKPYDVYSYAMVAYTIMTNKRPFNIVLNRFNKFQIITRLGKGERPKFSEPIPEAYIKLIESCWDNKVENRPTFEEITQTIENKLFEFATENVDLNEVQNYISYVKGEIDYPKVEISYKTDENQFVDNDYKSATEDNDKQINLLDVNHLDLNKFEKK